ncbi:DUF3826 domain-containing protein [Mucilaginibacter sp. RS28]|uniref:DUF3826 domain-containing protein n=2 Tax=Mucilaginibacter straminoryzae TaxID=2932774 RepID=A0A9X1X3R9_9SPHI|nr:DUF3826 domain-containing protein [Mucilaginibacter straminoryzae]
MKRINLLALAMFFVSIAVTEVRAQEQSADKQLAYQKMINQRAYKITATLGIADSAKFYRVNRIIANQYTGLNDIYTQRDQQIKEVKATAADNKDAAKARLDKLTAEVQAKVDKRHALYLDSLSMLLSAEQVDKVKDGMTYNVKNVTYKAYNQMMPDLTAEQKSQILQWLIEAREHSMDAETSEKKHAWFGKYKGRINNYLSKAGIDMKKAEADWQERIKAQATPKN